VIEVWAARGGLLAVGRGAGLCTGLRERGEPTAAGSALAAGVKTGNLAALGAAGVLGVREPKDTGRWGLSNWFC